MDDPSNSNEPSPVGCGLALGVSLVAKVNLAAFQNAVPILRELSAVNDSPDEAKDLELRVESSPSFLKPKIWHIDALAAGQRVTGCPNLRVIGGKQWRRISLRLA